MSQGRPDPFDEVVRAIVREAVRFVDGDPPLGRVGREAAAWTTGIDLDRARRWADDVGRRLAGEVDAAGGSSRPDPVVADRSSAASSTSAGPVATRSQGRAEGTASAGPPAPPHPRDRPDEDQGRALAALDAGRLTLDAAGERLVRTGEGAAPERPRRTVRALRARDWVRADGSLTVAGRAALERWLIA